MTNPFPGMDPYIEYFGNREDFHNSLITGLRNSLGPTLPPEYVVQSQERIDIANFQDQPGEWFKPDLLLTRERAIPSRPGREPDGAILTIEPISLDVEAAPIDEVRHTWVEIRTMPDLELVTVIEVLSKTNKIGDGRQTYLAKRRRLKESGVHLVEIDLVLSGPRVVDGAFPEGDYYAIVARSDRRPVGDVYAWSVRSRLPSLPIPLRGDDPDARVDLQPLAETIYDARRYATRLRRRPPLPESSPLHPDDRAWAEAVGREAAGR